MEKIIQITSGRGPAECAWVVGQVLKKVLQEASEHHLIATVLQHQAGQENGTVESALIKIEGGLANEFVASWIGTIQWIGKSTFRKFHQRKNWFIGIFEVEQSSQVQFHEKDIQYQAMRSSGAGGQHVNKVSSAIRATHIPTGIAVVSMDSRSQHQNKKLATDRLLQKLAQNNVAQLQQQGTDFKKEKKVNKNKMDRSRSKRNLKNEDYR